MEKLKQFINDYGGAVVVWLFLLLLIIVCSCTTTKYVEVPVEKTHTEYVSKNQIDSIYLRDSIYVNQFVKGDTVFNEKNTLKYLFLYKYANDTVHITDTVPKVVKYPDPELIKRIEDSKIEVAVQKKINSTLKYMFFISIFLLFATNYKVIFNIIKKIF